MCKNAPKAMGVLNWEGGGGGGGRGRVVNGHNFQLEKQILL